MVLASRHFISAKTSFPSNGICPISFMVLTSSTPCLRSWMNSLSLWKQKYIRRDDGYWNKVGPWSIHTNIVSQQWSTYIVASWTHDRRSNSSLDETETAYDVWNSFKENFCQWPKKRTVRLTNRLWGLKKGTRSLDEYLRDFKGICNALAAVSKLVSDLDKVFQLAQVLETKYMDFQVAMLSKSPYPSYNQFVLAL